MSEPIDPQAAAERLMAEAVAIRNQADEGEAQSLYDDLIDLMVAGEVSGATMFVVMCMVVASWVSHIGCSGCRMVEIGRMALMAKAMSDELAKANGGDDGDYHATRH